MSARVRPLDRGDIDAEVVDQLRTSFPRAEKFFAAGQPPPLPPVLGLLARHPGLAGPWLGFSGALLDGGVLDARTRELLILATAHRTGAAYVWNEHVPMAASAGVSAREVEAISNDEPHDWAKVDAALLSAVGELVEQHRVSDRTWSALAAHLDEQALLEVLFVVGAYSCLAMVLNSTDLAEQERST